MIKEIRILLDEAKNFADNQVQDHYLVDHNAKWFDDYSVKLVELAVNKFKSTIPSNQSIQLCEVVSADFSDNTVILQMNGDNYKVSAGIKYLCDCHPSHLPKSSLTEEEVDKIGDGFMNSFEFANAIIEAYEKKNSI